MASSSPGFLSCKHLTRQENNDLDLHCWDDDIIEVLYFRNGLLGWYWDGFCK